MMIAKYQVKQNIINLGHKEEFIYYRTRELLYIRINGAQYELECPRSLVYAKTQSQKVSDRAHMTRLVANICR